MLTLIRNSLWYAHHWDVALSYAIMLPEEAETRGGLYSERAARAIAHLGDSGLWFPLLIAAWAAEKRRGGVRTALLQAWILTLAITAGIVIAVKAVVRRPRPRPAGPGLAAPGPDAYSFPSGHAARMGASMLWAPALTPWGWLLMPLALAVSWSRVRIGVHTVGDIAAGSLLGMIVAGVMKRRLRRSQSQA